MRELFLALILTATACASTNATGRLPSGLSATTALAIPGRPVLLRSIDSAHFSETEVFVEMDRVPGPVRALRGSACPNREGTERYSVLEVDGLPAYAVRIGDGPRTCAVTAHATGVRVRVDEALDTSSLPSAVGRAIESLFRIDYDVVEAWKRTDNSGESVEVHVRKGGQEYVIVLTPSGTVRLRLRRHMAVLDVPDR